MMLMMEMGCGVMMMMLMEMGCGVMMMMMMVMEMECGVMMMMMMEMGCGVMMMMMMVMGCGVMMMMMGMIFVCPAMWAWFVVCWVDLLVMLYCCPGRRVLVDCVRIVVVGWYLIVGAMCDDVCFVVGRIGGWLPRMNFVMMDGVQVVDLCDHLCPRIVLVSVLVHRVDAVGCVMVYLIGMAQVWLYL